MGLAQRKFIRLYDCASSRFRGHNMKLFTVSVFVAGLVTLTSTPDAEELRSEDGASKTICAGPMAGTLGSVVVREGASCTLSSADVRGSVRVSRNAKLLATEGTVIHGSVEGEYCDSIMLLGSVSVRGNVRIRSCASDSGYIGPGILIHGGFECRDNSGSCSADKGRVGRNVDIHDNRSASASDVSLNTIGGDLRCEENSPAPVHALGPNTIGDDAQGQCATSLGFGVAVVPVTTQKIGVAGGTVTTPDGNQLTVPPGALTATTAVSLRSMSVSEVQVALESSEFAGQKLTFLGAVDIEAGGVSFASPIRLAIPNTVNLPNSAQVLVAHIVPDITGDGIPDLVLVDTASVNGGTIEDGAPGFPGILESGLYSLFSLIPPNIYSFVNGAVQDSAGLPLRNAAVWNSTAPDFVATTDNLGNYLAAVSDLPQRVFIAANSALTLYAVQTVSTGAPPRMTLNVSRGAAHPIAVTELCHGGQIPSEEPLNEIEKQLSKTLQSILAPSGSTTLNPPSPIFVGQTTSASVDDGKSKLLSRLQNGVNPSFQSDITLWDVSTRAPTVIVKSLHGVGSANQLQALVCLFSDPPTTNVASVKPNGTAVGQICEPDAQTFTVLGEMPGVVNLKGVISSLTFQAEVDVERIDGTPCPDLITPEITVGIENVAADPVPLKVETTANFVLSGVAFSDGGTASGSFSYTLATNALSNVNITTTGGTLPGATYMDSDGANNAALSGRLFEFDKLNEFSPVLFLRVASPVLPSAPNVLVHDFSSIPFVSPATSGEFTCGTNCPGSFVKDPTEWRYIVSGQIVPGP